MPEERRLVSVLFADMVGFTTLGSQTDPEVLREQMAQYCMVITKAAASIIVSRAVANSDQLTLAALLLGVHRTQPEEVLEDQPSRRSSSYQPCAPGPGAY